MIAIAEHEQQLIDSIRDDNLNRRQLRLRASYAQQNGAKWRAKGFEGIAETAYMVARAHVTVLLEKGAKRR